MGTGRLNSQTPKYQGCVCVCMCMCVCVCWCMYVMLIHLYAFCVIQYQPFKTKTQHVASIHICNCHFYIMLLIYSNSISSKHQHWTNGLTDISNFHCVKTKAKCQFWNKTLICLLKLTGHVRCDTLVYEQPPYRYCSTKLTTYPSNKSLQQVTERTHFCRFPVQVLIVWAHFLDILSNDARIVQVLLLLACLTLIIYTLASFMWVRNH